MLKNISNLEGVNQLTKEEQKHVAAGVGFQQASEKGLDIYCHCPEGGGWHVGTANTASEIMSLANQCEADGGTPSTFNPG